MGSGKQDQDQVDLRWAHKAAQLWKRYAENKLCQAFFGLGYLCVTLLLVCQIHRETIQNYLQKPQDSVLNPNLVTPKMVAVAGIWGLVCLVLYQGFIRVFPRFSSPELSPYLERRKVQNLRRALTLLFYGSLDVDKEITSPDILFLVSEQKRREILEHVELTRCLQSLQSMESQMKKLSSPKTSPSTAQAGELFLNIAIPVSDRNLIQQTRLKPFWVDLLRELPSGNHEWWEVPV